MKRILHIIPYKALFPPKNGGQLRSFYLMDQLARNNVLDVLSYQDSENFKELGYSNKNINFYTPHSFKLKLGFWVILPVSIRNALRYRWLRRDLKGPASSTVLDFAHTIKVLAKKTNYDLVVYEHITSMMLAPIVKRAISNAKTIIDAHNIDYKLTEDKTRRDQTKDIESNFYKEVDYFWACSQMDVKELESMNQNRITGEVVPNGVDSNKKPFHKIKKGLTKKLLFCGSLNYQPNQEGLLWFYDTVWPLIIKHIHDVELTIIGRGDLSPYKHFENDQRIKLIGEVEDVAPYYKKSYISIVPLLNGSGTRLKILEAMSFGNPIVTTSIGAEGIKATHEKEVLIADTSEAFANSIVDIIRMHLNGEALRYKALELVQSTYDWNIIGEQLNKTLFND
jgi:glycosyltransferase involved in cell wall biosynthesis